MLAIDLKRTPGVGHRAGRGVGRTVAMTLASAGASVVVNDLGDSAHTVAEEILHAAGASRPTSPFHVTDSTMVAEAIEIGADDLHNPRPFRGRSVRPLLLRRYPARGLGTLLADQSLWRDVLHPSGASGDDRAGMGSGAHRGVGFG